ncbi:uncharacterized protein LDX57_010097 [Aspergillus melleus]|uniref:uncharacterized protein n=1 Tax=Aspergillus melleus TaxID=138277 RepID=UPI001E8E1F9E|nr:uncharacterized protein LDX57_010097 [Aspergillus melleus]KAH8432462.1 hypothetical protein LDX57_010097 [Aspergillus melleus]
MVDKNKMEPGVDFQAGNLTHPIWHSALASLARCLTEQHLDVQRFVFARCMVDVEHSERRVRRVGHSADHDIGPMIASLADLQVLARVGQMPTSETPDVLRGGHHVPEESEFCL